jgi:hypothetical protein
MAAPAAGSSCCSSVDKACMRSLQKSGLLWFVLLPGRTQCGKAAAEVAPRPARRGGPLPKVKVEEVISSWGVMPCCRTRCRCAPQVTDRCGGSTRLGRPAPAERWSRKYRILGQPVGARRRGQAHARVSSTSVAGSSGQRPGRGLVVAAHQRAGMVAQAAGVRNWTPPPAAKEKSTA